MKTTRLLLALLLAASSTVRAGILDTPTPPAPIMLCSGSGLGSIYGANGSPGVIAATCHLAAGAVRPNSVLEINAHVDFTTNHAGRSIVVNVGGHLIFEGFPSASFDATDTKIVVYVAPDSQSFNVHSQFMNDILVPTLTACTPNSTTCTNGAPFNTHFLPSVNVVDDFTQAQDVTIKVTPLNDDLATVTGFSVTEHAMPAPVNYAPANALANFGNSLGAGTGSVGSFIAHPGGTLTSGSCTITAVSSITGVVPAMIISNPGSGAIPANSVVTGVGSGTITFGNPTGTCATASATSSVLEIFSGAWPTQLMYKSAGRPVYNNSLGGAPSAQILGFQAADKVRGVYWINSFADLCRDDILTPAQGGLEQCPPNLALMVANLAPGTPWVFSTGIPAANEPPGSANWNATVTVNNQIAALYPGHIVDTFAALTNGGTTNIPLYERNSVNTTGSCTSGSASLTVAAVDPSVTTGYYVVSPGNAAISLGTAATAPTVTAISGTTLTLSANCSATLSGAMISLINPGEVHLNDLGYYTGYTVPILAWLAAHGL